MADTLLDRLLATVDNDRIFTMEGADDPAAARSRLREMIQQVYTNAAATWDRQVVRIENDGVDHHYRGVLLFQEFSGELFGCLLEEFFDAVRLVADGKVTTRLVNIVESDFPLVEQNDRLFLYFLLGYVAQGIEECFRSARFRGGRNYRKAD